ncbi:hypothetical protein FOXYSP1_08301 [Fusarium oxysporum f. sp. phaseoli]
MHFGSLEHLFLAVMGSVIIRCVLINARSRGALRVNRGKCFRGATGYHCPRPGHRPVLSLVLSSWQRRQILCCCSYPISSGHQHQCSVRHQLCARRQLGRNAFHYLAWPVKNHYGSF